MIGEKKDAEERTLKDIKKKKAEYTVGLVFPFN